MGLGGRNFFEGENLAAVGVAAFGDFIGNIAHLKEGRRFFVLCHEGAHAAGAHQQTLQRHFADCAVNRHAGEPQGAGYFVF